MNDENRELLSDVVRDSLSYVQGSSDFGDDEKTAFKQAMEAIDRIISVSKTDDDYREHAEKLEVEKLKVENERLKVENERLKVERELELERIKIENEKAANNMENKLKEKELKDIWRWRLIELGATVVLVPVIDHVSKKSFAKMCMIFEETNTFTTFPGNSIRNFFKWK